ncbi:MAG: helix-turn-helix domain-containing protein [Clostridiales bacterium]|nr:helix-turn-helix domain-containing protein [Clostridiales bacterium]MCD8052118.1 helix-turn-helix domain-containing protein [Clostridiales bacterium]
MSEKLTLKPKEVAEVLGLGITKTYELMHTPDFPSFRVGKRLLVSKKALEEWLEKQQDG